MVVVGVAVCGVGNGARFGWCERKTVEEFRADGGVPEWFENVPEGRAVGVEKFVFGEVVGCLAAWCEERVDGDVGVWGVDSLSRGGAEHAVAALAVADEVDSESASCEGLGLVVLALSGVDVGGE